MNFFLYGAFGAIIFDLIRLRRLFLTEKTSSDSRYNFPKKNRILIELFLIIITALFAGILCMILSLSTPWSCIVLGYTLPAGTIFSFKGFPNTKQRKTAQELTKDEENFEEFEEDKRLSFSQYIKYAYSQI